MSTDRPTPPGAPWVRTRLGAARTAAVLAALLAFLVVLLATALPRAMDRGADRALRQYLKDGGVTDTSLVVTATSGGTTGREESGADLDRTVGQLTDRMTEHLRPAPSGPVYGRRGLRPRALQNPELAAPEGVPPKLEVLYLQGLAKHAKLVSGKWPDDGTTPQTVLSESGARTLGAKVGTVLNGGGGLGMTVVGLYAVDDPADPYWTGMGCLVSACSEYTAGKPPYQYWEVGGLIGPNQLEVVGSWGEEAENFWRLPVDIDRLRNDQLADIQTETAAYVGGTTNVELAYRTGRPALRITSGLPELFEQAQAEQAAAAPLAAIGPAGAAGVAAVVLCLAAALGNDRRTAELRLLAARGASRAGLLRRLLGESAVTTLPAAVLGGALALMLLPTFRWGNAVLAGTLVTLFTLLSLPLRVVAPQLRPGRRPGRRRLVAELLVLVVTAAAVFELRRRGVSAANQGVDVLLIVAPLLLALSGALLLVRLQPVTVGALARWTGRRPGLVGFLGLARATRGTGEQARPSVLPLLALVLAVTTAGFGATLVSAVDGQRHQAARFQVGADTAVLLPEGAQLPEGFTAKADALPGVHDAVALWTEDEVFVRDSDLAGTPRVTIVVVDPAKYAVLAHAAGHGEFDPAVLGGARADGTVPVLVTKDLANLAGAKFGLRTQNGDDLSVTARGIVDTPATVAGSRSSAVIVPAGPAIAQTPALGHVNRWYALGATDPAGVTALLGKTSAEVRTSAAVTAALAHNPLQGSAERMFWVSVVAAVGFALLAVLLALVRAAPDRAAILARLRTMGMRPREGVGVIMVESLPQAFTGTLIGALGAVLAVLLLGPAIDLTTMVGAPVATGLAPAVTPVLGQAAVIAALTTLGVLAEAALFGRRQITTELRAGDAR
ncbi:hypothetical protein ABT095_00720 [Kitasatospora sp. NPDC002227]|uniref:hypothetical protein n=1 Tax=Kitasatospora sp. NPDC002227 TaxID=3154773 RepID=UPI003333FA46